MKISTECVLVLQGPGFIEAKGASMNLRRGDATQPASDEAPFIVINDGDTFQSMDGDKTWVRLNSDIDIDAYVVVSSDNWYNQCYYHYIHYYLEVQPEILM